MITTDGGIDISLQSLLRLEDQFLLARGRLAGTTDAGRIFCVPYDRMVSLSFTREMKDARVRDIFGDLLIPVAAAAPEPAPESPAPAAPAKVEEPPPPKVEQPPPAPAPAPANPFRERLLNRLATRKPTATEPTQTPGKK
jgi:hypothetical protein